MKRTLTHDRRRSGTVLVLVLGLLAGMVSPARASIWTGSCVLELEFTFGSKVRSVVTAQTSPSYTITVTQAADLDPDTPGTQACAVSLNLFQPFRSTSAGGSGTSDFWTCERTLGDGIWEQWWNPTLPYVFGSHAIAGTWGDWTMVLTNPNLTFTGVIALTVHPDDALKLQECRQNGITSLRMLGIEVFQDPEI